MTRLTRPHIPLEVRCQVAVRQLLLRKQLDVIMKACKLETHAEQLAVLLHALFPGERVHLDHDPPLCLRHQYSTGKYEPDACDPEFLIYRTAEDHRLKTFVRGDGAQLSDAAKRRKELKRKRKIDTSDIPEASEGWFKKAKLRWPSRKIPSRPFQRKRP